LQDIAIRCGPCNRAAGAARGNAEVRVLGDHESRPDRERSPTVDEPMEGTPQRVRGSIRRTPHSRPKVTVRQPVTPLS
jgi:hypothetical protein